MGIITTMRRQKAVRWPLTGVGGSGQPTFGSPEEFDCRWEDSNELFLTATGDQQVAKAKAFVDQVMEVGDLLRKGEFSTLENPTSADPFDNSRVYRIEKFDELPNLRVRETLRTAWM